MTTTKILIEDRNYTSWKIVDNPDNLEVEPLKYKLFHDDTIYISDNKIEVVHSPVKTSNDHPGVLVLDVMKTYGKKKDKFMYKCIPDDRHLPIFLVPYKVKENNYENKYITFKYDRWRYKHPEGIITNNLGDVSNLTSFYEYQLYCKSLNASIQKFTQDTTRVLKKYTEDEVVNKILNAYPQIKDRTKMSNIFTIDPPGSTDYDDGFSVKTANGQTKISIYIANVTLWMEGLDLWNSFSNRIATIYLPDRRRPMLPTRLSDFLCSLQENQLRFALVCELTVEGKEIKKVDFFNSLIRVYKNYRYEEPDLLADSNYIELINTVKPISRKNKYASITVQNSNELVSYLMITMNYYTAKKMIEKENGIYRSAFIKGTLVEKKGVPDDVLKQITMWNSASGQYQHFGENLKHELLDLESYVHITSPIRRLVDLLNMITLQTNLGLINFGKRSESFYSFWHGKLDYINTTMRSIRKVQTDCTLLNACVNDKTYLDKIFTGYIFDKIKRMDGMYQFMVYLDELKMFSRVLSKSEIDNFTKCNFKMYVFQDEDRLKRKIRIQML